MKKLDLGDLFTRDEFREHVKNGWFIDTDGEGQYSNENGDWTGKWLSPSSFTRDEDKNKNMGIVSCLYFNVVCHFHRNSDIQQSEIQSKAYW